MSLVSKLLDRIEQRDPRAIARAISIIEDGEAAGDAILSSLDEARIQAATVIGITGPPGAGKSTLTNRMISQYRAQGKRVGIIAIDPSSPVSGGALLGDRIRMMRHALDRDVVIRSMATRGRLGGLCASAGAAVRVMAAAGCAPIVIETVGVGQSEMDIVGLADITVLVLAPGLGDDIQAMKAGLLEVADILVVNKADLAGAEKLMMELEAAGRTDSAGSGREVVICKTIAAEGEGVDDLLDHIAALDRHHRSSGEHHRRRRHSHALEILDWSLAMLRPRLLSLIEEQGETLQGDPRRKAREIIGKL